LKRLRLTSDGLEPPLTIETLRQMGKEEAANAIRKARDAMQAQQREACEEYGREFTRLLLEARKREKRWRERDAERRHSEETSGELNGNGRAEAMRDKVRRLHQEMVVQLQERLETRLREARRWLDHRLAPALVEAMSDGEIADVLVKARRASMGRDEGKEIPKTASRPFA
jgi:hypothetical protein